MLSQHWAGTFNWYIQTKSLTSQTPALKFGILQVMINELQVPRNEITTGDQ